MHKRTLLTLLGLTLILCLVGCASETPAQTPDTTKPDTTTPTTLTWQSVTNFSGSGDMTTDRFYVRGKKFRLTWEAASTTEAQGFDIDGSFYLFVYPDGETALYAEYLSQSIPGSKTGLTYVYEGPGWYYLKLITANLGSWSVAVESYH